MRVDVELDLGVQRRVLSHGPAPRRAGGRRARPRVPSANSPSSTVGSARTDAAAARTSVPSRWARRRSTWPAPLPSSPASRMRVTTPWLRHAVDAHPQQHRALDGRRRVRPREVHDRLDDLLAQRPEARLELLVRQLVQLPQPLLQAGLTRLVGHRATSSCGRGRCGHGPDPSRRDLEIGGEEGDIGVGPRIHGVAGRGVAQVGVAQQVEVLGTRRAPGPAARGSRWPGRARCPAGRRGGPRSPASGRTRAGCCGACPRRCTRSPGPRRPGPRRAGGRG